MEDVSNITGIYTYPILIILTGIALYIQKIIIQGHSELKYWSLANILSGVGYLLFIYLPHDYLCLKSGISGMLIIVGNIFYFQGLRKFHNHKREKKLYVIPLIFLVVTFIASYFSEVIFIRIATFALAISFISILSAREFIINRHVLNRTIYIINGSFFALISLSSFLRTIDVLFNLHTELNPNSTINIITLSLVVIHSIIFFVIIVFLISIKQQKQLELQIHNRDKLFNIIAHDLRNPVSTLHNYLNMLSTDKETNDVECSTHFAVLETMSGNIQNVLMNLLYWSKARIHDLSPAKLNTNITEIINNTIKLYKHTADQKSIKLSVLHNDILQYNTDETFLNIILRNLISNAIKFTNTGGYVKVSYFKFERSLIIEVEDSGDGMSHEKLEELRFCGSTGSLSGTSGELGTGLGLSISFELVEKLDGTMEIESELNKGTKITITL